MAPVDIYLHWISPACHAVTMTCLAAGIPTKYHIIDMFKKEHKEEAYVKISPESMLPTIGDDGFYLWESRAVIRYLLSKFAPESPLYPQDLQKRAVVERLLDYDMGTVAKTTYAYVVPICFQGKEADREPVDALLSRINETLFKDSKYANSDVMTVADIYILASLVTLDIVDYKIDAEALPHLSQWMKRMKETDFFPPIDKLHKQAVVDYKKSKE